MMQKISKPRIKKPKDARQTRVSGGGFVDKIHAYLRLHAHALFSSLGRLMRSPFASLMTISVMAIALALAGGFYLLVANVQQFTGNLEATNQISVFLQEEVTDKQGQNLADKIKGNANVLEVKLITKQQALQEFREYSGFGDALNALQQNPLPTVIQVLPKNSLADQRGIAQLMGEIQRYSEVDFVQMDMQWIIRLQSIMQLAQRGVFLLSMLLAFAVLFITGNTIRLELQNRKDEVLIAKLVGATHAFIQRPFLYSGFWYGFMAGLLAWLIITMMMLVLDRPAARLSELYEGSFGILYLSFFDSVMLLFISSILGVAGALIVLSYQLQQLQPE